MSAIDTPLDFDQLRGRNIERCETSYHAVDAWSPTDWACALAGEVGEACNLIKKMRRLDGQEYPAVRLDQAELRDAAADEIADAVIYADLLAARLGIDLGEAIRDKFNQTSKSIGSEVRL